MDIIENLKLMQETADSLRRVGKKIGVVPTMGYLHEGHLSLIRKARHLSDVVITTIFVNPTQFGPAEDFKSYPRSFAQDQRLAKAAGTDIIFYPTSENMYPPDYLTYVEVDKITQVLCGASRPTHFRGVTTVVTKLFNLTKPHLAIFGQKDAQQALVIRRMVRDLNMDVEIIVAPIVREADGLAMSSRNVYLTPEERRQAVVLYHSLQQAQKIIEGGEKDPQIVIDKITELIRQQPLAQIDYIALVDTEKLKPVSKIQGEILIAEAVKFGKARLIDNIILNV